MNLSDHFFNEFPHSENRVEWGIATPFFILAVRWLNVKPPSRITNGLRYNFQHEEGN